MADDKSVTETTGVTKKPAAKKTGATAKKTAIERSETPATVKQAPPVANVAGEPGAPKKSPARKATPTSRKSAKTDVSLRQIAEVSPAARQKMIEDAAYYKSEKRHFAPGHEADDWADAEREIDDLIARAKNMTGG